MKSDLSESQVKALLIVASKSRRPTTAPYSDLLDKAANERTTVQELAGIKEQAKGFLREAADSRHRDAATLLYHVTVAAAFVRHGAAISGRPIHKQLKLYEKFAATWEGHPLGQLFRAATRRVAGTDTNEGGSRPALVSGRTKSSSRSARAAWARCIARMITG